jgi:hypothetical protein
MDAALLGLADDAAAEAVARASVRPYTGYRWCVLVGWLPGWPADCLTAVPSEKQDYECVCVWCLWCVCVCGVCGATSSTDR